MAVEEAVIARILQLIEEGAELSQGDSKYGRVRNQQHLEDCMGWITAAHHVVTLVCPSSTNAYRQSGDEIAESVRSSRSRVNRRVGEFGALLKRLGADIDAGLLASVANQARAEIFDEFLDHADSYLKESRKNEAGAIAGVVFEDTIRRICRDHGITESDIALDALISELVSQQVITQTKAKRASPDIS